MNEAARQYLAAGLCVLPARTELKFVAKSVGSWKRFQTRLPTVPELEAWLANALEGLCLICGAVSGHLEAIDFDLAGEAFEAWRQMVRERAPGLLERLVIERSPSGGWHVYYRGAAASGSIKLAQRKHPTQDGEPVTICGKQYVPRRDPDGNWHVLLTLIETKGEGGLILCAPTPGYELTQGDLCQLPVITAEERDILLQCAWELSEYMPPVVDGPPPSPGAATGAVGSPQGPTSGHTGATVGLRPGDDFSQRGDVRDLLQKHGWTLAKGGENEYWRRPGKTCGNSATLKDRVFYVFSSSADPFEPNRAYSPFAVYALLEHGGNWEQAARQLRLQGYGSDDTPEIAADVDLSGILNPGVTVSQEIDAPPESAGPPDPGPFPDHLLEGLPDIVQVAMDYYVANAIDAQPVMFLASFLAATGAVLGHKVKDGSGLRTNLYTVGVLGTGSGKEATRETVDRVFQRAGLAPMCGAEDFASDSGLLKAVSETNPILFQIDEFGRLMHSIKLGARHSPHLYNIVSVLLKLYSKANGTFRSKAYADSKRNIRIDYPHVCVYGTTVQGNFWDALSIEAVKDGFLPRLMIFETPGEGFEGGKTETEPPEELVEFFRYWTARRITMGNLEGVHPSPMVVPCSPEAADFMEAFRAEQKREVSKHEELGPLWSRARENAGKLALIHACWKNSEQPVVETDSAEWAVEVTRHVVRQTLWRASLSLVDNPFHAECQKALQKLQEAPNNELAHSVLLKRMKMKARDFKDLMATLYQRGDVKFNERNTSGRTGQFYRLCSGRRPG